MNILIHAERTCLLASRFLAAIFSCFFIHGSAWGAGPVGSGETQSEELLEAARAGDMAAVQRMLDRDRGVSLEVRDPMGLTSAQVARLRGQEEVLALLAAHGAIVDEPLPAADELVERLLRGRIREDGPGVAVLVGRHGKVVLKQASGLAQIEDGNAVRPDTRFPIESITKPFTAAAILKLQEEGKMYVGDKLAEYLPDFPRADEVTIHQLLTHTSGIQSYTAKYYSRESVMAPISSEALIESFRDDPYNFDPGTQMRYNNSGYFLLGHLIERISGQAYGDFLRERFFEPLAMHNTGLDDGSGRLGIVKDGYFFRDGKFALTEEWHPSWGVAAGSLYSTVEDLFLWNEAVFGGRVLSESSLEASFTPEALLDENISGLKEEGYGYGWAIHKLRGARVISHEGAGNGFTSYLMRVPEEELTVVILTNMRGDPDANPRSLAHDIAEIYLSDVLQPRVAVETLELSEEEVEAFVGRYDIGLTILTVTREEDRLFAALEGESRVPVFPKSATGFFFKVVEAEIEFIRDADGRVHQAVLRQGGQTLSGGKLP